MNRKKYTRTEEASPALLKFREKRKWQINLRRYVLQQQSCPAYAPYFGLDIKNMRLWFEYQFSGDITWDTFGKLWQFDHILPVTYFDYSKEEDLFLCWNFTNLRVEPILNNKDRGHRVDVLMSKRYFEELYRDTGYHICKKLLDKIDTLSLSEILSTEGQKRFIKEKRDFLDKIENYSFFEFELLNYGKTVEDVQNETAILKNLSAPGQ